MRLFGRYHKGLLLVAAMIATLSVVAPTEQAWADNTCAARCYALEKACMRETKGGRRCDGVATRCLQNCFRKHH